MNHPGRPSLARHVAIVGAGFAGTLQAINLLRHEGPRATLIERRPRPARGLAYSTVHPGHLLNVRAGNMSALPDEPDHFVRWLGSRGGSAAGNFVPRALYGEYLAELLDETMRANPGRLTLVTGSATGLERERAGWSVMLEGGGAIAADTVILALGNLPPHDPPGFADSGLPADLYAPDPWAPGIADDLNAGDSVLIAGTGLTMIDIALLLEAKGFAGRIIALSRRGLLPHAHGEGITPHDGLAERPGATGAALVRAVRERADAIGWRPAIDELRPWTQAMWLAAPPREQSRFLRHLRPWWDIHRHRLAPDVASRIAAMRARGQLEVAAGKFAGFARRGTGLDIRWRSRGTDVIVTRHVRRLINCTGPQGDLLRTDDPLLRFLHANGHVRPDAHRLGLDVTPQAETIDAAGRADPNLLALGPMTRGAFWEIVAVPDIRVQTWAVARKLSHAHWVGGEGL